MLDKAAIRQLIPHAGAMCLPDAVVAWDREGLRALADNHRDPHHPLREAGRLGAICAVEYAAQAMALHAALGAGSAAPIGFLAALRSVQLHRQWLDDLPTPLAIEVRQLAAEGGGLIYEFTVHSGGLPVVEGRATVIQRQMPP